ncbi:hypothetical protein KVJ46_000256 [Enterococcus faecalis]|nr:hypothetical protein [Enterococcus faecalis]
MKKVLLFLTVLVLFISGCAINVKNGSNNSESSSIAYFKKNEMNTHQAQDYYGYINGLKLSLVSLAESNQSISQDKELNLASDFNKTSAALDTTSSYYKKLRSNSENEIEFLTSSDNFSPLSILSNMHSYNREMSVPEKEIIVSTINSMTKNLLNDLEISIESQENLYNYFEKTCYEDNQLFKDINSSLTE